MAWKARMRGSVALMELAHTYSMAEVQQVVHCMARRWWAPLGCPEIEVHRPEEAEEHTGLRLSMKDEEGLVPSEVVRSKATACVEEQDPSVEEEELSQCVERTAQVVVAQ